jgi:hypothetical protein
LKDARASGVLECQYSERRVRYKSDSEMARAIAALEAELAELEGLGRPMNVVVRGNRGWL